jgi:DNA (cytosine-5)-methyltransferase 1
MLQQEGFLRVKEAAELLGVSPNAVRSWGAEAKIPEYRHPVNNYRLYKRDDLTQVLQDLENSVNSPARRAVTRKAK